MTKILLAVIAAMGIAMGWLQFQNTLKDAKNETLTSKNEALENINSELLDANQSLQTEFDKLVIQAAKNDAIIAKNRKENTKIQSANNSLKKQIKDLGNVKPIVKAYLDNRVPADILWLLKRAPSDLQDKGRVYPPSPELDSGDTRAGNDWRYKSGFSESLSGFEDGIEIMQHGQNQPERMA